MQLSVLVVLNIVTMEGAKLQIYVVLNFCAFFYQLPCIHGVPLS